jgi:ferritin-like protein
LKEEFMATNYHEPFRELPAEARDIHRALTSLVEELEAVDWYHQRAAVTGDEELKAILLHNRDEEIEHAAMCLEYLRRLIPRFDDDLKTYLFTSGPIAEIEEGQADGDGESGGPLGIGGI